MKSLNVASFKEMLKSGNANLDNHKSEVDTLNVFPVPDGDTGTNMSMTFTNGYKEAMACPSNNICDVAKALSKGLLMGARGNSGVILSQIFRGFANSIEGKDTLKSKEIAEAFINGSKVAYKAIMKPVEGTILTVIREAVWYADHDFIDTPNMSIEEYFDRLTKYIKRSVDTTPELLPILAEANVVDSGGMGLYRIFEGFNEYLKGKPIVKKDNVTVELKEEKTDYNGYHVELDVLLFKEYQKSFDIDILNKRLKGVCDKVDTEKSGSNVTIKVDATKPGEVLNIAQRYGDFVKTSIINLKHEEKIIDKTYGIICVACGSGIEETLKELGADIIVTGGQTMNPSTKNFVDNIEKVKNCKNILIFPNNSNIILAAEQARDLSNSNVYVVPTKSMQECISCLSVFNAKKDLDANKKYFKNVTDSIVTISLTYSVKDTSIEGQEVKKGDYLAMSAKKILASDSDMDVVLEKIYDLILSQKKKDLLTIIVGEDGNNETTQRIVDYIEDNSKLEVSVIEGNQPVYSYLFGLE